MPANQSKIESTQTDNSLTKRGEENQTKHRTYRQESTEIGQEKLRSTLLSLSSKLDEMEQVNRRLFQLVDSDVTDQADSCPTFEDDSTKGIPSSEMFAGTHLAYQLSYLMDGLKTILNCHHWGVFILKGDASDTNEANKGFEEVASSYHFQTDQTAKDFEKEVNSLYTCGNVQLAITRKKRMRFPTKGGNMLIVPLALSDGKVGFWAMHFDMGLSVTPDSDWDWLLWGADMITTCLESLYRQESKASAKGDYSYWLVRGKLFSLIQLSRAMVHEVNNSMQIILGRAQIARMNLNKSKDETNHNHTWETVENNAIRVNGILKNFSDFLHRHSFNSRSPANQSSDKEPFVPARETNFSRILESNLSLLQYLMGSSGIELELKKGDDSPSVIVNPEELEVAFLGLLWGIRDKLTAGGEIRIQIYPEEKSLSLTVEWNGRKNNQEKSPGGKASNDIDRLIQSIRILEKIDHNLIFENTKDEEGKIKVRIPFAENPT